MPADSLFPSIVLPSRLLTLTANRLLTTADLGTLVVLNGFTLTANPLATGYGMVWVLGAGTIGGEVNMAVAAGKFIGLVFSGSTVGVDAALQPSTVVNNLTTGGAAVPLSAQQGVILKGFIDSINALLASDETSLDQLQEIVDFIQLNRADLDALGIANIAGLTAALDGKAPLSAFNSFANDANASFAALSAADGIEAQTREAADTGLTNALNFKAAKASAALTAKATLVDADVFRINDSQASDGEKKTSWANLKTMMEAWLPTAITAAASKATPIDADEWSFRDSVSGGLRKVSSLQFWTNYIKPKADALYVALTGAQTVAGAKTLSGQLQLTGQAATDDNSAMTRKLVQESRWSWLNPNRLREVNDYFSSGSTISGSIGDLGWETSLGAGATMAYGGGNDLSFASGRAVILQTGTTINTDSKFFWTNGQSEVQYRLGLTYFINAGSGGTPPSAFDNSRIEVGFSDQILGGGQYQTVGWDTSLGANWRVFKHNGTTETIVDSGIAVDKTKAYSITFVGENLAGGGGVSKVVIQPLTFSGTPTGASFEILFGTAQSVFNTRYYVRFKNLTAVNRKLNVFGVEARF